jgi:hypothetical protein
VAGSTKATAKMGHSSGPLQVDRITAKIRISTKFLKLVVLALALCVVGVIYAQAPKMDPGNFEILGIRLGTSTIESLKQTLGSAPVTKAKDPENSLMCYTSNASDRTVLQFENWTDPIEFRLFRGTVESVKQCLPTDRVSASISTASGLKLGLGRDQLVKLLGRPQEVRADHWSFESSTVRPLTTNEKVRASKLKSPPSSVEVYEKIDIEFADSVVTKIDVVRSESW